MFRTEVLDAQKNRLEGDVILVSPFTWFGLTGLYVLLVFGALIYLAFGSYARTETVPGRIYPSTGVVAITPRTPGMVTHVAVRDGQQVRAGDLLAAVKVEQNSVAGHSAEERALQAVEGQITAYEQQNQFLRESLAAEIAGLQAQITGADAELVSFAEQIRAQTNIVELQRRENSEVQTLLETGAISRRELQRREETLISREQQLSSLIQQQAQVSSRREQAIRQIAERQASSLLQSSRIEVEVANLERSKAELEGRRSYTLTAPLDGRITALTARVGDSLDGARSLMSLIPTGGKLQVELHVPSSAIGFMREGQEVRLRLDAFPYQRFGTVTSHIQRIAEAPTIEVQAPAGMAAQGMTSGPMYLVIATLDEDFLLAFGREMRFQPGMTLQATIITERRSLFEWLFEPVLAVQYRS